MSRSAELLQEVIDAHGALMKRSVTFANADEDGGQDIDVSRWELAVWNMAQHLGLTIERVPRGEHRAEA